MNDASVRVPWTRLFEYDDWANGESIRSVQSSGGASPKALAIASHVIAAEDLWYSRIQEDGRRVEVWPARSQERLEADWKEVRWRYAQYLQDLERHELARRVAYVNSKAQRFENTVEDILFHVLFHSTYHRGQIALALRSAGTEPPYTDYIHCVREGLISE